MAWSDMAFEVGGSLIQQGASFLLAKKQAKSDKAWQAYRNRMVNLANAQNQNTITTNTNLTLQRSALQEAAIRKSERLTLAATAVAAATQGTRGNSVAATMRDVRVNAAEASGRRQMDLETQLLGLQAQRESSNLQTAQQTEYSPIPTPTGATELMGFASDMLDVGTRYKGEISSWRSSRNVGAKSKV